MFRDGGRYFFNESSPTPHKHRTQHGKG